MFVQRRLHAPVLGKRLAVSFTGGSVMGLGVAGLAVLGLGGLFIILKMIFAPDAAVDSVEMVRQSKFSPDFRWVQNLLHCLHV